MKAHRLVSGLLICLLIGFGLQNCSEKKEAAQRTIGSRTAHLQGGGAGGKSHSPFPEHSAAGRRKRACHLRLPGSSRRSICRSVKRFNWAMCWRK